MTPIAALVISTVAWLGDSFTFIATDPSGADSNEATVTLLGVNGGTLIATDVDGDPLTFRIASPPSNGIVTLTGDAFTYAAKEIKIVKTGPEGVFYTLQRSLDDMVTWTDLIVFLTPDGIFYDVKLAKAQFYRLWTPL